MTLKFSWYYFLILYTYSKCFLDPCLATGLCMYHVCQLYIKKEYDTQQWFPVYALTSTSSVEGEAPVKPPSSLPLLLLQHHHDHEVSKEKRRNPRSRDWEVGILEKDSFLPARSSFESRSHVGSSHASPIACRRIPRRGVTHVHVTVLPAVPAYGSRRAGRCPEDPLLTVQQPKFHRPSLHIFRSLFYFLVSTVPVH